MRRIPYQGGSVGDNLVNATGGKFLRGGGRADGFIFGIGPDPQQVLTVEGLRKYLMDNLRGSTVPPHELVHFVTRLLVFLTSSDARRFGQWEHISWWNFVGRRPALEGVPDGPRRRPDPQPGRGEGDHRQHPHHRQHG